MLPGCIRGLDAPETNPAQTCYRRLGRGDMDRELALGEAAADALDGLLANAGYQVRVTDVDYDDDRGPSQPCGLTTSWWRNG